MIHRVQQCSRMPTPGGREEGMDMSGNGEREAATRPEDLARLFVERANAGDLEGLVALYERGAMLALPSGEVAIGKEAIRRTYKQMLAERPTFTADGQRPTLVNGKLALTSMLLPGGATAEVARRQPDGTWLWAVDQPNVLG
jgi:ketosteroid isomerase-like protein